MPVVVGHSQTKYLSEYLPEDKFSVFSYPGYRVRQFVSEDVLFEVVPFFSVAVLVVGANDIGFRSPEEIVSDIEALCVEIRRNSPSVTVLVSEVLPRCHNLFKNHFHTDFLDRWNKDAALVNRLLHIMVSNVSWIEIMQQSEFHTMFVKFRNSQFVKETFRVLKEYPHAESLLGENIRQLRLDLSDNFIKKDDQYAQVVIPVVGSKAPAKVYSWTSKQIKDNTQEEYWRVDRLDLMLHQHEPFTFFKRPGVEYVNDVKLEEKDISRN